MSAKILELPSERIQKAVDKIEMDDTQAFFLKTGLIKMGIELDTLEGKMREFDNATGPRKQTDNRK